MLLITGNFNSPNIQDKLEGLVLSNQREIDGIGNSKNTRKREEK